MYSLEGRKVADRRLPSPVHTNDGGYKICTAVTFDGSIKNTSSALSSKPLTVLITTFKPDCEAKFRFTVHYKHAMGTVRLEKF